MTSLNDKCKICGKTRGQHKANGKNCPSGRRHRGVGNITYAETTFVLGTPFKPKFTI